MHLSCPPYLLLISFLPLLVLYRRIRVQVRGFCEWFVTWLRFCGEELFGKWKINRHPHPNCCLQPFSIIFSVVYLTLALVSCLVIYSGWTKWHHFSVELWNWKSDRAYLNYYRLQTRKKFSADRQLDRRTNDLRTWYHFSGWNLFYVYLMWPATTKRYVHRHVLCPLFYPILSKFVFSRQIFIKVSSIRFYGNLSSWSRSDACGATDRLTWRKSICAFREYAKAP